MHSSHYTSNPEHIYSALAARLIHGAAASSTPSTAHSVVIDPLLEQMASLLSPNSPTIWQSPSTQRRRRFSDTDRGRQAFPASSSTVRPDATSVLSRDGKHWLPAPEKRNDQPSADYSAGHATKSEPSSTSSPSLEPHKCRPEQCAALKVFGTTELLETILGFLDTKEILSIQRTNQFFYCIINNSPRLKLHHFVHGQWYRPASDFQLLPFNILPGLTLQKGKKVHLGQWISISMTLEAARRLAPRTWPKKTRVRSRSIFEGLRGGLGPRAKAEAASDNWMCAVSSKTPMQEDDPILPMDALLISQPPVLGVQAYIIYAHTESSQLPPMPLGDDNDGVCYGSRPCCKLSRDSGITLGDLAQSAQKLLADTESSSTKYASKVVFKAIMSFCAPEQTPRKRDSATTTTPINYDEPEETGWNGFPLLGLVNPSESPGALADDAT